MAWVEHYKGRWRVGWRQDGKQRYKYFQSERRVRPFRSLRTRATQGNRDYPLHLCEPVRAIP